MITQNRKALAIGVGLAGLAGFVDAVGFIKLGGFFISFMSGNSTRFAVNFSHHELGPVFLPLALICLFVIGVMLGTIIEQYTRKPAIVMGFVTLMLFFAAGLAGAGTGTLAVAFMVLAMGAENIVLVKQGQVTVGVTYMTGTLVKLGQKLAGVLRGDTSREWIPYLCLWAALVIGAVLGAVAFSQMALHSLWIAAWFSVGLTVAAWFFLEDDI
jgi:uncharacterized membrane protein YoaK (UPF0700 family)